MYFRNHVKILVCYQTSVNEKAIKGKMTKIQIISCEICDMTFTTVSTLIRHKKLKHQHINSEISCRTCKDNYEKQDIHLTNIKNSILQKITHLNQIHLLQRLVLFQENAIITNNFMNQKKIKIE